MRLPRPPASGATTIPSASRPVSVATNAESTNDGASTLTRTGGEPVCAAAA